MSLDGKVVDAKSNYKFTNLSANWDELAKDYMAIARAH